MWQINSIPGKDNSKEYKRLFIALPLPLQLREYMYENILKLKNPDKSIKYIPPQNIHITLKFLGSTDISKINKIEEAVKKTAADLRRFHFNFENTFNAFPSLKKARVIFLPLSEGGENVNKIYSLLEDNLSRIKIRKDQRKFVGHVTLARMKNAGNIADEAKQIIFKNEKPVLCSSIVIFESILKPQGAEYSVIEEFELK